MPQQLKHSDLRVGTKLKVRILQEYEDDEPAQIVDIVAEVVAEIEDETAFVFQFEDKGLIPAWLVERVDDVFELHECAALRMNPASPGLNPIAVDDFVETDMAIAYRIKFDAEWNDYYAGSILEIVGVEV